MKEVKILAPCGMLGYGFPEESFLKGMEEKPDAIVVDAGSTDGGPHKLGAGVPIVGRKSYKKDLDIMIREGYKANIPVIIGSAGGSGGEKHVRWSIEIITEILEENDLKNLKVAVIWADIKKEVVTEKLKLNEVVPLGKMVKELTLDRLERTTSIVAQMGHEPIIEALKEKADIIICGRAYDPSPFASVALYHGFSLAYGYHLGKILECAALCAEPGTTKDCMLGILREDGFIVKPLSDNRICTTSSVAAHTFYEKSHPFLLKGPGMVLDLENCEFSQYDEKSVFVTGSKYIEVPLEIKLEGSLLTAYRTFVVAGIRDEILIEKLEDVEKLAEQEVRRLYSHIEEEYIISFKNYGINGVMGELEQETRKPYEVGVVFEVISSTQELSDLICSSLRSSFLHFGYTGRKSTAGNLAFPFAPSDISFGPVYEFSVYHLMKIENPLLYFPIEYMTLF